MALKYLQCSFHPRGLLTALRPEAWRFFFKEERTNIAVMAAIVAVWQLAVAGVCVWSFLRALAVGVAWRRWMAGGVCCSSARLDGRTAIVTGANVGLGKETARDLLARGARVILACRDEAKAEAARRELAAVGGRVEVRRLDLASLASVRAFAKGFSGQDLHILVNNAGVMACPYTESEDGFEVQMATNHLGHFLLTNLLLPNLTRHNKPSRVINVASLAHLRGRADVEASFNKASYDKDQAYADSKMANILFTCELAKKLEGSNVSVFSLHPGVVLTDIGRHLLPRALVQYVLPLLLKTTAEGAQTTLHCALEATQDASCAHYFSDCAPGWAVPLAASDQAASALWTRSAQLVKLSK